MDKHIIIITNAKTLSVHVDNMHCYYWHETRLKNSVVIISQFLAISSSIGFLMHS